MNSLFELNGKHVIITGASGGIGRATSKMACELGARVSLIGRNSDKLTETGSFLTEGQYKSYVYDFTDLNGIEDLVSKVVDENGPIDGLVHCAGICENRPLKLMKPEFVEEMLRISYFAFVEMLRCITVKKRSNNGASFVGVSSTASVKGEKTQGAYAAAKGAMNSLVHPLAKELAMKGMRINTVAFGMVETDMYVKSFLEAGGNNEYLLSNQYLGIIKPENAAATICYLLCDASYYMTGGTLFYDGGCLS